MKVRNNKNRIIRGLTVEVKYDNVDKAIRKLKKGVEEDGRIDAYKERKHYIKPTEKRRLAKKAAILRQKRSITSLEKKF